MAADASLPDAVTAPGLPADVLRQLSVPPAWITSVPLSVAMLIVGLGAVAGVVVWLFKGRRRRSPVPRKRPRRWVAAGLAVVAGLGVAAGGAGIVVNTVSGAVPDSGSLRIAATDFGLGQPPSSPEQWAVRGGGEPRGSLTTVRIPNVGRYRMAHDRAWVYLPPGYASRTGARYPVLYLIHGSPGRASNWFAGGRAGQAMDVLLAHGLVRPTIVVSVDVNGAGRGGGDTECLDSTRGGARVESYLTEDAVPWVDGHFRTVADRADRYIGGMSAGGFCALNVGLRHLDLYSSILDIEGYGDPGTAGPRLLSSPREIAENSPSKYIPAMDFDRPVSVFFDTGTRGDAEDRLAARRLAGMLERRGQRVLIREDPGGHSWWTAAAALPYGLTFLRAGQPG